MKFLIGLRTFLMKQNYKLLIVSGPPGSGKTSIMRSALGKEREIVSVTTRPPRNNERHGIDYIFISREQMEFFRRQNQLIQYLKWRNYEYGLLKSEVKKKLSQKKLAYVIVSVNGMLQIKQKIPEVATIFFDTTKEDCIQNMRSRGDSEEEISKRIQLYESERQLLDEYDHIFTNTRGCKEKMVSKIKNLLQML